MILAIKYLSFILSLQPLPPIPPTMMTDPTPCGGHQEDIADHPNFIKWLNLLNETVIICPPYDLPVNQACRDNAENLYGAEIINLNNQWRNHQCNCWESHPNDPIAASLCMDTFPDPESWVRGRLGHYIHVILTDCCNSK